MDVLRTYMRTLPFAILFSTTLSTIGHLHSLFSATFVYKLGYRVVQLYTYGIGYFRQLIVILKLGVSPSSLDVGSCLENLCAHVSDLVDLQTP